MPTLSTRIDPKQTVILFADLQVGIVELTRTVPLEILKKSVSALAKLAALFDIPVIVTGIRGQDASSATIISEITDVLGPLPIYHRTTCDSLLNPEIVAALEATGRKTLLISGVATELAVQLPAVSAPSLGYSTYVVLDACGGIDERTERAALHRIAHAGATTVSVMTLAGEMAGDFRDAKGQQAIGILYSMARV